MANTIQSPDMSLPVPVVGTEVGPAWATDLNNCLSIIDSHTHSPGSGAQITPSGLNINADLTLGGFNATALRSTRFTSQASPLALSTDLSCVYVSGGNLYYNNSAGTQVQITNGSSVSGSTGTITGLPSGTAGASFQSASGTFQFIQATSTAANMDIGTIVLRYPGSYPTPSGNYIALEAPTSLATGYAIKFPATLPGTSGAFLTESTAGVLSYTNVDNATLVISSSQVKIPSNVNLPGTAAKVGSSPIAVSNANDATGLAIARAVIDSSGAVVSGAGVAIANPSTGVYTVVLSYPFSDTPAIAVSSNDTSKGLVVVTNISGSQFTVSTFNFAGTAVQGGFSFVAVGLR